MEQANQTPENTKNEQQQKKKYAVLLTVLLFVIIASVSVIIVVMSTTNKPELTMEQQAYYAAREVVSRHLKAPAAAEYQPYTDGMVTVRGNNKYTVNLWVDAQNSFGAMIRTYFMVDVELQDGAWYYTNIQER